MSIKQLSIFVENRKGSLSKITDHLAELDIDMKALSVADTPDYGILRLIVSDTQRAVEELKKDGQIAMVTEVTAAAISDEPGRLAEVLHILAAADINLEYLYAFISRHDNNAYVVLRVPDNAAAEAVLSQNGIPLLTEDNIKNM